MSQEKKVRVEKDTLGTMEVPEDALYGAQTARAVANFPISGWQLPQGFLSAQALIKHAFAAAHQELGMLPSEIAGAIMASAQEVIAGAHREHFPLDVFQTGSGTSTNMNTNEVIAHLANKKLGGEPSKNKPVHPNDHVNLGQSSNDTIPASLRIANYVLWAERVEISLAGLIAELARHAKEAHSVVTLGRTHLMDAVPTTYGLIFDAWARRLKAASAMASYTAQGLLELPLGGTAVGTGVGAKKEAVELAVQKIAAHHKASFRVQENPSVGISSQDAVIAHADALAGIARVLLAIANDLRLRGSGPFGGLGELRLQAVQPGSSIMPGKVNPVIPEAVAQVALQVEGLAQTCRASAALHQLDLSHANPLLAWNLDTAGHLLASACDVLVASCLREMTINLERARAFALASPAMATGLANRIGYEKAAEIAKESEKAGEPVSKTARRLQVLPDAELDHLLDLERLVGLKK